MTTPMGGPGVADPARGKCTRIARDNFNRCGFAVTPRVGLTRCAESYANGSAAPRWPRVIATHARQHAPLQRINDRVRQNGYSILATFAITDKEQVEMAVHLLRIHAA